MTNCMHMLCYKYKIVYYVHNATKTTNIVELKFGMDAPLQTNIHLPPSFAVDEERCNCLLA